MIAGVWAAIGVPVVPSAKICRRFIKASIHPKTCSTLSFSSSLKCRCHENGVDYKFNKDFSVISTDIPWEEGSVWSTMAIYMFNLHIPLGIGGLSIVAYALHQPVLDPQTEALSLLLIQVLELTGGVLLLMGTAKPDKKILSFFKATNFSKRRNWLLASSLGFGVLGLVVFLTALVSDWLIGSKDVNNLVLKEILLSSDISKVACVFVYCLITPMLEEMIYRGFLLTCLTSTLNWQRAVFVSSAVFSAAHFSGENFLQLLIIGCILGCCYCWTGNTSEPEKLIVLPYSCPGVVVSVEADGSILFGVVSG